MYLDDRKCFTIYNQKLAGYLMMHGFPLRDLVKDRRENAQKFNLFMFDNTQQLQNAISEWHENRKK